MKIPRSSFYASQKETAKQAKDKELVKKIEAIQNEYFYTIGRRRMGAVLLRRYGIKPCETTLQRQMSEYGLSARIRQVRKAKPQARGSCKMELPGNLLDRKFQADRPLYRMVTDVTYVPYFENGEWHRGYLSLVQDLFDRSIVAWVYSKKQDVRLALNTMQIVASRKPAPGAMLHSDRGCIYTASDFREIVSRLGITHSFSRTANCHDNATMECFNGTFKVESQYNPLVRLDKPSFKEQNDLIGRYIEFYNNKRPCSVLGNITPAEFSAQYWKQREKQESAQAQS